MKDLQSKGEPVIDLEGIAGHKGSAFGNIGLPNQPSQEMFENILAAKLIDEKIKVKPPIGTFGWKMNRNA